MEENRKLSDEENYDEELKKEHLEGWFDIDVLSIVPSIAFQGYKPLGWDSNDAYRKGSASIAVATRKNINRKSKKQKAKMGCRGDAIFRAYKRKAEYGAIEVARVYS
ncbi:hypothetical protein C2G38_2246412 [Gigaspora rosea]|uniref:Uncharacterized protein n=1 Tax=Gigaspora rosea TaxID=44941 RepID=A0A397V8Z0_9GLOM|nr:hypothetical protein C2G38_2246412 [Gigaspora rosea]